MFIIRYYFLSFYPALTTAPTISTNFDNTILKKEFYMPGKKTLVLGATPDSSRYAYLAANKLVKYGHSIVNVGIKTGEVAGVPIEKPEAIHTDIDTITLYVGPQHQTALYDYILNTHPKRILFNPGTENSELQRMANEKGIETDYACTLV